MAFLWGLFLAPPVALLGSVLFFTILIFFSRGTIAFTDWMNTTLYGAVLAMLAALPVCGLILPIAYGLLHKRGTAEPVRLALVGAAAGFVVCCAVVFALWTYQRDLSDPIVRMFTVGISALGAVCGAIHGVALALIMRHVRPAPNEG